MIQKFVYGKPINTDAVVSEVPLSEELTILKCDFEHKRFSYTLEREDIIYGLGEAVRGINKRGWYSIRQCISGH